MPLVIDTNGRTEAGYISPDTATAGSISVDDALVAIANSSVLLDIGQELPKNKEFEFIKKDIDHYKSNKYLNFHYTGMHWKHENSLDIRNLHHKVDEYWENNISL